MTSTNIVYHYQQKDENGYWGEERSLCFICAIKIAVKADTEKEKIYIETTDYESCQCYECGKFLEDEIDI